MSKPERAKEAAHVASEFDLTRQDLLLKIAIPFRKGEQFFCGGAVVRPANVQEVRFSRTQQSSKELLPLIRARRSMHPVITFASYESDIIWEGEDVTREILDEAGRASTADIVAAAETRSDRVFVVHGHDERAVDQTEILIRRFGLTPIILRETPSKGRTVIEKFDSHRDLVWPEAKV